MRLIVRLLGALCVMVSCMLAGCAAEHRMKRRWHLLKEMQEILAFLEKEMTYHRAPLPEALRSAAWKCSGELARALVLTAEKIESRNGQAFALLWEESLADCIPEGLLSAEELCLLRETAAALCNADTVTQRALLEKYADRFRMMSRDVEEACREKGGLYRKLAAAAGIFLVVVLI